MALCANEVFPDLGDLDQVLEGFLQVLNERSFEAKTNKEGAVETSSGSLLLEEQGDCPLASEDYVSALEKLLDNLEREESEQHSHGPAAPLPQVPAVVTSERQTCAEAVPTRDTAEPAASPDLRGTDPKEGNQATDQAKPKSRRGFRFSPYQRNVLADSFKANRNLPAGEMKALAAQLQLSPCQVQNWFRNERKKYKMWFAHLLDEEHGVDSHTLLTLITESMSLRSAVGSMAHRLLKK